MSRRSFGIARLVEARLTETHETATAFLLTVVELVVERPILATAIAQPLDTNLSYDEPRAHAATSCRACHAFEGLLLQYGWPCFGHFQKAGYSLPALLTPAGFRTHTR